MPFLLLFVLTLTCLQREWPAPPPWFGWPGSVMLTWGVVFSFGIAAWLPTRWWCWQYQRDPSMRHVVMRRFGKFRSWHLCSLIFSFLLLVCLGGWGWFIGERFVHGETVLPGVDLVLLSPLFAGLMLSWAAYYPLERALALANSVQAADSFPGRWNYVTLQTRHNFILVAPPLLLMFLQQAILAMWPGLLHNRLVLPLIGLGLLGAMYAGVPWLLRLLLGLVPLPPGMLRDRLLATSRRLSFRCSDILVWDTRRNVVNAMVTGPLPFLRYVVLTDRLMEELTPDEVEAVFGHEVGHVKHHHLLFYFGFLLASLVAVMALWNAFIDVLNLNDAEAWLANNMPEVGDWLESYQMLSALPLLGFLGVYIVVVFGFLSRRCERQADIYGCRTVSVPVFVEALEKVARLNGISRDKPGWLQSWQHSTIARRIEFLQKMEADPEVEPRFQRRVGLVKWGLALGLGALLAALGPPQVWAVLGMLGN